jgi:hypothetical protein
MASVNNSYALFTGIIRCTAKSRSKTTSGVRLYKALWHTVFGAKVNHLLRISLRLKLKALSLNLSLNDQFKS